VIDLRFEPWVQSSCKDPVWCFPLPGLSFHWNSEWAALPHWREKGSHLRFVGLPLNPYSFLMKPWSLTLQVRAEPFAEWGREFSQLSGPQPGFHTWCKSSVLFVCQPTIATAAVKKVLCSYTVLPTRSLFPNTGIWRGMGQESRAAGQALEYRANSQCSSVQSSPLGRAIVSAFGN
jgi:hypothetical protein